MVNFFSLLGLIGFLNSCADSNAEKHKQNEPQSDLAKYVVTTIKSDTLKYNLTVPGDLKPYEQVTLYAKIDGFVTDLKVDRGDMVKKGQLLLRIEAPEIQQKLLAAKAKQREIVERLHFSQQNLQRTQDAASVDGVVSTTELQQTRTQYLADSASLEVVRAEVAAAAQLEKYTEITAPFDGVVTQRLVSPGALVGGGEKPLLKIYREDKLRLEVAIPSKHAKALHIKNKASFRVNSYPGREFTVELSRSSKSLNAELRSMMVEFDYDNSDGFLDGGDYAEVNIDLKRYHPTLQVPSSSVITTPSSVYIAKVVDGKAQLVPVTTGLTKNNKVEVFGNIKAGDQVIVKANSTLKDGMKIVVSELD